MKKMILWEKRPPGLCGKASNELEKRGSRLILYMLIGDIHKKCIIYINYSVLLFGTLGQNMKKCPKFDL